MSNNTYQQARLVIGDEEYSQFGKVKVNFPGNSKINSLSFVLNDSDMQEAKLLNKEVKFYLNYGAEDSVPMFRGFVRDVKPTQSNISITAYDGRTFIQGKEAQTITLSEIDNYDGSTASQFLADIIRDKVNIEGQTRIGLNMLNETNPPVLMKGVRAGNQSPYELVSKTLKKSNDTDSINDGVIYRYNIDMIDDGITSNIVFVKEKSLDSEPSATFAYLDGIESYTFSTRAVPSYIRATTQDGKQSTYQDGNLPKGLIGANLKGRFPDTASATEAALFEVIHKSKSSSEINIKITKGFDIGIGSIIRLVVPEDELNLENHRVVSKSINYSEKGTSGTLKLNREPRIISDYLSS